MRRAGAARQRAAHAGSAGAARPALALPFGAATREHPTQVRLYVADRYPMCIQGVATELSRHDDIALVGSALRWGEATREVADIGPDVALIDDSMARSCASVLDALGGRPRVIFLTHSIETASVYEALAGGAAGYLTRDIGPDMLVRALRDAFDGRTVLTPELQTQLANEIRIRVIGAEVAVSPRERRILQLIADGMSTREIAVALGVSRATVKSDVSAILLKLDVHDRASAVAAGFRKGFID